MNAVRGWVDDGFQRWDDSLAGLKDGDLDGPRPLHWGGTATLGQIVVMVDHEVMYHTGELNMLLSIARGEAWEYTEEVEENHISTIGHGVRANWMSDEHAAPARSGATRGARSTDGSRIVGSLERGRHHAERRPLIVGAHGREVGAHVLRVVSRRAAERFDLLQHRQQGVDAEVQRGRRLDA